jgi:hypothetical protein
MKTAFSGFGISSRTVLLAVLNMIVLHFAQSMILQSRRGQGVLLLRDRLFLSSGTWNVCSELLHEEEKLRDSKEPRMRIRMHVFSPLCLLYKSIVLVHLGTWLDLQLDHF